MHLFIANFYNLSMFQIQRQCKTCSPCHNTECWWIFIVSMPRPGLFCRRTLRNHKSYKVGIKEYCKSYPDGCNKTVIFRLELDNYELYSGTPANFTVRTVDKYSNNLNEWIVIGNFVASNDKMMVQHFSGLTIKSFGKFVRVDLETFHGTEHFCTLTSFRWDLT